MNTNIKFVTLLTIFALSNFSINGHNEPLTLECTTNAILTCPSTATLPLYEDFEGGTPPTGWTVNNPDGSYTWETGSTTGSDGMPTQTAYINNYAYDGSGELDELVMPCVDLSKITNPQLCFDVAYAPYHSTIFERLHIEFSTDCGATFATTTYDKAHLDLATTGYQLTGWEPASAADWRAETVDLTPYKSTQTIFKFIQTAGYANSLFIDNVRIKTNDPPVANYTSSYTGSCLEVGTTVDFTDTSMEAPTAWAWTFTPSTVSFQGGTSASSQNPQVSFDAAGSYTVMLTVTNPNGSHSVSQTLFVVGTVGSLPLVEYFEGGVPPTGWSIINPDASATWGMAAVTGSNGASSQTAFVNNYSYNSIGQMDELVLPNIDISAMTTPVLCFEVAYARASPTHFDRLHIEASTDCANSFVATAYDKSGITLATAPDSGLGFVPTASDWRTEVVDLTPYKSANTVLKFINTTGWGNALFIDNVSIKDASARYVQVKTFLQGSHNGTNMNTDLQTAALIPLTNPYGLPESVTAIPPNVVDWVKVELRSPSNSSVLIAHQAAFLRNDGQVIDTQGNSTLTFYGVTDATGYVVVRHRNHLGVMTNMPVSLTF